MSLLVSEAVPRHNANQKLVNGPLDDLSLQDVRQIYEDSVEAYHLAPVRPDDDILQPSTNSSRTGR